MENLDPAMTVLGSVRIFHRNKAVPLSSDASGFTARAYSFHGRAPECMATAFWLARIAEHEEISIDH